jgi:hypothetical protein
VIRLCACFGLLIRIDDARGWDPALHFVGCFMTVWEKDVGAVFAFAWSL